MSFADELERLYPRAVGDDDADALIALTALRNIVMDRTPALIAVLRASERLKARVYERATCPMCGVDMEDDDHLAGCEFAALRAALAGTPEAGS